MAFVLGLELLLPEVILDTRTQKTSIISISTKCLLLQEPLIRKKKKSFENFLQRNNNILCSCSANNHRATLRLVLHYLTNWTSAVYAVWTPKCSHCPLNSKAKLFVLKQLQWKIKKSRFQSVDSRKVTAQPYTHMQCPKLSPYL